MKRARTVALPRAAPSCSAVICHFFFNDTATTEIYTLSLHDALPIYARRPLDLWRRQSAAGCSARCARSEEHTSELQSPCNLVCRLLLEKKRCRGAAPPWHPAPPPRGPSSPRRDASGRSLLRFFLARPRPRTPTLFPCGPLFH